MRILNNLRNSKKWGNYKVDNKPIVEGSTWTDSSGHGMSHQQSHRVIHCIGEVI